MLTETKMSRLRAIEREMGEAGSYEEWKKLARKHDRASGIEEWKRRERTRSYDYANIKARLKELRKYRDRGDDVAMLFALNEGIHGNMGGMGKDALYTRAKFGTKKLITDYVDELCECLKHISSLPENQISLEDKLDFFERASHCFGRSALMLSGAGSLGHFHTGVVKTLIQQNLLPTVISGSSAGAILAGIVGTHTLGELKAAFDGSDPFGLYGNAIEESARGFVRPQVTVEQAKELIAAAIPDVTFQESYERTGRMINVTIAPVETHQASRLMNAITSPNVFIRTAVLASCAVPGVFPPVMLMAKNVYGEAQPYLPNRRWMDGAVTDDLPAKRLARLYGVNHYIVSQANPLSLLLLNSDRFLAAAPGMKDVWRFAGRELLRSGEEFSRRYLRPWPDVSRTMNLYYSVAAQDYTGDINIVPSFSFVDPQKLLGQLTRREIDGLIADGERATWPRVEQIRIATEIGRILDAILDQHRAHDIRRIYKRRGDIRKVKAT